MTVARDASITFFPVGNGDTTLIRLSDGATILIDLNVRQDSLDDSVPSCYDVRAHLLRIARYDEHGRPHIDVFVNTHPDQDHVRGVENVFYFGPPEKYSAKDKAAGRIIIDELWFAPRVFALHDQKKICDDAKVVRNEAVRRIARFRASSTKVMDAGDRVRVIGYTSNPELAKLSEITVGPGQVLSSFNHQTHDDFSLFVHAPFKRVSDGEDSCRNDTSIVFQARFVVDGKPRAALAFLGGDAECEIWEEILDKSNDEDLEWDLLLAPHHCSWTFFSHLPSEDNHRSEKILKLLAKRRKGAIVVVSSKEILDDDDNPPHFAGYGLYQNTVGADRVLSTAAAGRPNKPEPIVFTMSANGPVRDRSDTASTVRSSSALQGAISTPRTYG